jgi:hypothetical protein
MSETAREKMSDSDFAGKVDWEGGVIDALDYGLHEDDLYAGKNSPLYKPWQKVRKAYAKVVDDIEELQDMIDVINANMEEEEEEEATS